jgi:hypothetical protein
VSYSNLIIGAAIFDVSGLPKKYLISTESNDVSWVQTIFQALGLQALLISSFKLEGFQHVIVHAKDYRALVVKQKTCYVALLCKPETQITADLIHWANEFQPATLNADPRFSVV